MTGRTLRWLAVCVLLPAALAACGKKGNPLPPLRPVPARIADLTAVRTAGQVELRFTVPAANLDGTVPVVIERVDVFAVAAPSGQVPPAAGALAANPRNLLESLPVRRPVVAEGQAPDTVSRLVPLPGEVATYSHPTAEAEQAGAAAMYYVVVPVAGTGRGRPGPPTPVANVPLGPLPEPPSNLAISYDATTVRVTWTPAAIEHTFQLFQFAGEDRQARTALTPKPVAGEDAMFPVRFGEPVCVAVQAVQVTGPVSVEGATSEPVCTTPVDRYPPPIPSGLRVVQEGPVVTLIWDPVEAADLGGYVVFRGSGDGVDLVPLTRDPQKETTYRDTTAVAGATYSYAVASVDTAPAANVSALSTRETLTVR